MYREPQAAPASQLPEERRGRTIGLFCLTCASIYPLHRLRHSGKPMYGKDHVAAPCAHEGDAFEPGAGWWEPAVLVLPQAMSATVAPEGQFTNAPTKGTQP